MTEPVVILAKTTKPVVIDKGKKADCICHVSFFKIIIKPITDIKLVAYAKAFVTQP